MPAPIPNKGCAGFDEALPVAEDLGLWIKPGIRGKIAVLGDILINYYDIAGSLLKRHAGYAESLVKPMLEKHIAQQQRCACLTATEIRTIRGGYSFQLGCALYFSGNFLGSIPQFVEAVRHGARPVKSLLYIPRACVKHVISADRRRRQRMAEERRKNKRPRLRM